MDAASPEQLLSHAHSCVTRCFYMQHGNAVKSPTHRISQWLCMLMSQTCNMVYIWNLFVCRLRSCEHVTATTTRSVLIVCWLLQVHIWVLMSTTATPVWRLTLCKLMPATPAAAYIATPGSASADEQRIQSEPRISSRLKSVFHRTERQRMKTVLWRNTAKDLPSQTGKSSCCGTETKAKAQTTTMLSSQQKPKDQQMEWAKYGRGNKWISGKGRHT